MGSPDLQWSLTNWIQTWPNIFQLQTQDSGQTSGTWIIVFCCLFSTCVFPQHGTTLSTMLNMLIVKLIFPSTDQTGGSKGHGASLVAVVKRKYVVPAGSWTQFQVIQPLGAYSLISIFKFRTQNTAHAETQYLNNWSQLKIILNLVCHCMIGLVCMNAVLFMCSFLVNETNRHTEFQFYWYYDSTCFGQPFRPSSGVLSHTSALVHYCRFHDRMLRGAGSCSW